MDRYLPHLCDAQPLQRVGRGPQVKRQQQRPVHNVPNTRQARVALNACWPGACSPEPAGTEFAREMGEG